jgi:hypothetical protein
VRFLLDHDVPAEIGHLPRYWGYQVVLLKDVLPTDSTDDAVFAHAQRMALKRITCNRDHFVVRAEQALAANAPFEGLSILIRRRSRQAECAQLFKLIRRAGEAGLRGNVNFA